MSRELYNTKILVDKKNKLRFLANSLVRECAPGAFKRHTKKESNKAIYRDAAGNPKIVTYVPAGTFDNLIIYLRDLNKLIQSTSNTRMKIQMFLIQYFKVDRSYPKGKIIDMIKRYFEIDNNTTKNVISTLRKLHIITVENNNIILKNNLNNKYVDVTNNSSFSSFEQEAKMKQDMEKSEEIQDQKQKQQYQENLQNSKRNPIVINTNRNDMYKDIAKELIDLNNCGTSKYKINNNKSFIAYMLKYMIKNHCKSVAGRSGIVSRRTLATVGYKGSTGNANTVIETFGWGFTANLSGLIVKRGKGLQFDRKSTKINFYKDHITAITRLDTNKPLVLQFNIK